MWRRHKHFKSIFLHHVGIIVYVLLSSLSVYNLEHKLCITSFEKGEEEASAKKTFYGCVKMLANNIEKRVREWFPVRIFCILCLDSNISFECLAIFIFIMVKKYGGESQSAWITCYYATKVASFNFSQINYIIISVERNVIIMFQH